MFCVTCYIKHNSFLVERSENLKKTPKDRIKEVANVEIKKFAKIKANSNCLGFLFEPTKPRKMQRKKGGQ